MSYPKYAYLCINRGKGTSVDHGRYIVASLQCSNCGTDNPSDARFCQKCGSKLFHVCRRCGTENTLGVKFCKACGTDLSEAKFALADDAVSDWRRILGGLEGWSPALNPSPKELAVWEKLTPPMVPEEGKFIFCVALTNRFYGAMQNPSGDIKVSPITIRGTKFEPTVKSRLTGGLNFPYLLATESRLVVYHAQKGIAEQVLYDQIVSLNAENDRYTLGLQDRTQVVIETRLSRSGLLAVAAVMGAPMDAKGDIVRIEKSKARRAETFVAAFSRFFMEIIEENRKRR
ncbi:MAG: zinc ribbon domain-containing protein [Chloroflexi bacterium]|nr:zinc ribbon domain-containing protein [Chloroflexota bacterium]